MQRDEVGPRLTVPIVNDVIDARESLLDLEPPDDIDSCFHFDPKKFQDEHEDIALDAYHLDEDELEEWGKKTSSIRARFQKIVGL